MIELKTLDQVNPEKIQLVLGCFLSPHRVEWPAKSTEKNPVPQLYNVIELITDKVVCGPFDSVEEANDALRKYRAQLIVASLEEYDLGSR